MVSPGYRSHEDSIDNSGTYIYALPQDLAPEAAIERLQEAAALVPGAATRQSMVLYDTFDWRLYQAGLALERVDVGEAGLWRVVRLSDGEVSGQAELAGAPRFAWDLPPGALRDCLEPLIAMRALLPLGRVTTDVQNWRVLNEDQKTVVRAVVERHTADGRNGNERQASATHLRLIPLKGYDKELAATRDRLVAELDLVPANGDLVLLAAEAGGRDPGYYSTRLDYRLDPEAKAGDAVRQIGRVLAEIMLENEAGTREDIDTEFLHDFRVSIRRMRSLLALMKATLPARKVAHLRQEFADLFAATGAVRDLDVYLLKWDDFISDVPATMQADLEPMRAYLAARRETARAEMIQWLDSERYQRLVGKWLKLLSGRARKKDSAPKATVPIAAEANRRIWRMYCQTVDEARAINAETPPEPIHELRKTAKKLRYLLEFFGSLYPPEQLKALVAELKQLQTGLGDYQDLHIQIAELERIADDLSLTGGVPPQTLLAMGALLGELHEREQRVRAELNPALARFVSLENEAQFRRLFAPAKEKKRKKGKQD